MYCAASLSGLFEIDWLIFQWINSDLTNKLFDWFLPLVRNAFIWVPVYTFIIAFLFFNYSKKAWLMLFFFLMTASVCDFVSSSVIKPSVERLRPCNDDQISHMVVSRVSCGAGYSFPSSHATNHMGMAVFLLLLFKNVMGKWRYIFLLWAFIISFAQIYVGVHFPSDIFAGWLLGSVVGMIFYKMLQFYIEHYFSVNSEIEKT